MRPLSLAVACIVFFACGGPELEQASSGKTCFEQLADCYEPAYRDYLNDFGGDGKVPLFVYRLDECRKKNPECAVYPHEATVISIELGLTQTSTHAEWAR